MIKIQNLIIDRQNRNKNWNQKLIDDAKVTIKGTGPLANFVAVNLVSLNVGNIRIIDNSLYSQDKDEFVLFREKKPGKKSKLLESALKSMNPYLKINGIDSKVIDGFACNSDVLIDLTNDLYSINKSLSFSDEYNVPLLFSAVNSSYGVLSCHLPVSKLETLLSNDHKDNSSNSANNLDDLFFSIENQKQGIITSAFFAGLITEEVRKLLFRKDTNWARDRENLLKNNIYYFVGNEKRFVKGNDLSERSFSLSNKKILISGAGALGNSAGINAALMGVGQIDIVDMDYIEETNLNRQPLYSFDFPKYIGQKKVDVISNELRKLNSTIKINGIYGKLLEPLDEDEKRKNISLLDENFLDGQKYDLILGCLDNVNTRARINEYCVDRKMAYIDGGTGPFGGRVAIYVPGKTACLDCLLGLYKRKTKNVVRDSCVANDHEPSVIMTNQIIGALMMGEAALFLSGNYHKPPLNIIVMDSYATNRVNIGRIAVSSLQSCKCYGDKNE